MTRKRKGEENLPQPCASSEEDDLQAFCSQVCYQEISFEDWQAKHKKLDLQYPLKVCSSLLSQTSKTVISLTRTITTRSSCGRKTQVRERFQCEVQIDSSLKDKAMLRYPGLGDKSDDAIGDLIVVVQITE